MNKDLIIIKNQTLPAKIAITEQEHRQGLMYYSQPTPIMVFPYDQAVIRKFWMKNTPSPLDLVFCLDNKIIDICQGIPYDLNHIGPNCVSDLVIEFPQGMAKKMDLTIGDNLKIVYSFQTLARSLEYKKYGSNFL